MNPAPFHHCRCSVSVELNRCEGERQYHAVPGLFHFQPGTHSLRLVCVGSNPASQHPETGKPRYNLTADVLSIRKLPFDNFDKWIKEALEKDKQR